MGALTVAQVRQRIAAHLEGMPEGWRESRWSYDSFPVADPQPTAHLAFAVGVPVTTYDSALESVRHKRPEGTGAVTSQIGVRWLYKLRHDAPVASDYDGALAAELAILVRLSDVALIDLHLSIVDATRRAVGDGSYLLGEIRATTRHRIPIA